MPDVLQRHLPMLALPHRQQEPMRAQPIVCIRHHGARSAQVVAFPARQGFEAVYNLAGGIDAWPTLVDPSVSRC